MHYMHTVTIEARSRDQILRDCSLVCSSNAQTISLALSALSFYLYMHVYIQNLHVDRYL